MRMRRILGVAIGAALVVVAGAGTVAWAGPGRADPALREAAKACVAEAKAANPDADRATVRAAARPCLEAAGIDVRHLTPEQEARRAALRECVKAARDANPDAANPDEDRPALREAVGACLGEAGIEPGAARDRLRQCVADAKAANPDADRPTLRPIVRACMTPGG